MKKDIVLAGVGGQGILTIAVLIVEAAIKEGLNFRQSEVHGMSQRGGAVESHVRLSGGDIYGDLIAPGTADLLISVEPLEALRNIDFVSPDGLVVTSTVNVKNMPGYPPQSEILDMLRKSGRRVYLLDADAVAKEAGNPRAQNVALAGAAAQYLGLKPESLRACVAEMFGKKGQAVIDANLKAFELGAAGASGL